MPSVPGGASVASTVRRGSLGRVQWHRGKVHEPRGDAEQARGQEQQHEARQIARVGNEAPDQAPHAQTEIPHRETQRRGVRALGGRHRIEEHHFGGGNAARGSGADEEAPGERGACPW